jgi:hypothetical protein
MKTFNVINPEAIGLCLDRVTPELGRLLHRCLFRALLREEMACARIRILPRAADRPPWLTPERFAQEAEGPANTAAGTGQSAPKVARLGGWDLRMGRFASRLDDPSTCR